MVRTRAELLAEFYRKKGETAPQEELDKCAQQEMDDKDPETMPELIFSVKKKGRDRTKVHIPLVAAVVGGGKLCYLEAAASNTSTAVGLMAALSDRGIDAEFYLTWKPDYNYQLITPPTNPRCHDIRLKVEGWHKAVHHVAALDRAGELVMSDRGLTLWRKIRERMTTPTLDHWANDLVPKILKSGMILEARTYGIGKEMWAYVITPDAQGIFDDLVSEHVKEVGFRKEKA